MKEQPVMEAITSGVNECEELSYFRLQLLGEGFKRSPFEVSRKMFPPPQLEDLTLGSKIVEIKNNVFWHSQIFALVESSVVYLKNIETIEIRFGEFIKESLISQSVLSQ